MAGARVDGAVGSAYDRGSWSWGFGRVRRMIREVIETIALVVLVMVGVNAVVDRTHVEGPSMQPTLKSGQFLLTNKLAYSPFVSRVLASEEVAPAHRPGVPQRGDIVILRYPADPKLNFVKRVVGLPGETVEVRDGVVFIDGEPLDEPYLTFRDHSSMSPVKLGTDRLFVMGDNRPKSNDSRAFGPIALDDVVGRAWFRYWPLTDLGVLEH